MKQPNQIKIVAASLLLSVCLAMSLTSCKTQTRSLFIGGSQPVDEQIHFAGNNPAFLQNCVGTYYGCFKMTNGASTWFSTPTNVVSGTFSNLTFLGTNINWSLLVTEKSLLVTSCCTNNGNSISFPATYSTIFAGHVITNMYSFYLYVNTPTNSTTILSDPIDLQVVWTTGN